MLNTIKVFFFFSNLRAHRVCLCLVRLQVVIQGARLFPSVVLQF